MADRRKENGGHSTKSKSLDKRKNQYKTALQKAATVDDVVKVLSVVKNRALKQDMQAAKLFLEYYLGKPTQVIEGEGKLEITGFNIKDVLSFDKTE